MMTTLSEKLAHDELPSPKPILKSVNVAGLHASTLKQKRFADLSTTG
jgi:hypothetical protein